LLALKDDLRKKTSARVFIEHYLLIRGTRGVLVSISPTFYKQLLLAKIPKAKKKTVKLSSFIALLGSARVKATRRTLVKLTQGFGQAWMNFLMVVRF